MLALGNVSRAACRAPSGWWRASLATNAAPPKRPKAPRTAFVARAALAHANLCERALRAVLGDARAYCALAVPARDAVALAHAQHLQWRSHVAARMGRTPC